MHTQKGISVCFPHLCVYLLVININVNLDVKDVRVCVVGICIHFLTYCLYLSVYILFSLVWGFFCEGACVCVCLCVCVYVCGITFRKTKI